MPFYFPSVPVWIYLVLALFSLPLLMFVPPIAAGVRKLAIIIWTIPAERRVFALALFVVLLAIVRDPCTADMPYWMRLLTGCG